MIFTNLLPEPEQFEKTIDIGCGHNPIKGVTHAIDGYTENVERGADLIIPDGVDFSVQNIETGTNFDDKEFDFSYCRMVLEHTIDPAAAIKEIIRISKSGFIEVPTWTWELLHGRPYHKQLIWLDGDELVFMEKNDSTYRDNTFPGDDVWAAADNYQKEFAKHIQTFTIRFVWEDHFFYRIQEPFNIFFNK